MRLFSSLFSPWPRHRRRVNDLPLTYGELVTASLAKSFGRSPMGIENNIKADYSDCKVNRAAIKKAIQKLLDAGTIRHGACYLSLSMQLVFMFCCS